MKVFPLYKYIERIRSMIERKEKAVRNSNSSDFKDSTQLDIYRAKLNQYVMMQKNGEKYYIKF
jgi:hypothetical protein